MGTNRKFSREFKEAMVKKLIARGSQTVEQFSEENGMAVSTITRWKSECANISGMKHKNNKSKYSAETILQIISETHSLNEEELGLYVRQKGLHTNQIADWRACILSAITAPKVSLNQKDARDSQIKDLEKDIRKKDKALAEVSALLILQKKVSLLWGTHAEEEGL